MNSIEEFLSEFQSLYNNGKKFLKRKPKYRIVWTLASGLPIVKMKILKNPHIFLEEYDKISFQHPGEAYDCASLFAENKKEKIEIVGMKNTMVCDFFKNLGLLYYVKLDAHLKGIIDDISFNEKLNKKAKFILSWLISKEIGLEPFYIDKIIFIGRKFAKDEFRSIFLKYRNYYVSEVNKLIEQIPIYL
jgi:hypothetical protein